MAKIEADMTGKVCIVTGANSGIGLPTAEALAGMGATVVMACRDPERSEPARRRVAQAGGTVNLMTLDLASQQNVRDFAAAFLERYDRLDVLVNNAGIMTKKREETEDGIEKQFGVNHLGHFLLTLLLLNRLKASAPSRIVNVSSTLHQNASIDFDNLQLERGYTFLKAYGQSKLANVLFTYALARRLDGTGVVVNALHPGGVRTGILRDAPIVLKPLLFVSQFLLKSPERGARTSIYLAAAPEAAQATGAYFVNCREAKSSAISHDVAVQERLWKTSETLVGLDS